MDPRAHTPLRRTAQQGVSLIFALIALVALMLGALALVRHIDTAAQLLGNLGFKQDATAATEPATREALTWLTANAASLNVDVNISDGGGYYASNREYEADGITAKGPLDLTGQQYVGTPTRQLIDWNNDGCKYAPSDSYADCSIKPVKITKPINGNNASYVIFRMCNKVGDIAVSSNNIKCAAPLKAGSSKSSSRNEMSYTDSPLDDDTPTTYYRVLVRVQGVRNTTSVTETIVYF